MRSKAGRFFLVLLLISGGPAWSAKAADIISTLQVRSEKSNQFIRVDSTEGRKLVFWDCQQFDKIVCEPLGLEHGYSKSALELHMLDLTRKDRVQSQVHEGIRFVTVGAAILSAVAVGASSIKAVRQMWPDKNWPKYMKMGLTVGSSSVLVAAVDEITFWSGLLFYDSTYLDQTLALQQVQRDYGLSGEAKVVVSDREFVDFREALFIALESFERSLLQ